MAYVDHIRTMQYVKILLNNNPYTPLLLIETHWHNWIAIYIYISIYIAI